MIGKLETFSNATKERPLPPSGQPNQGQLGHCAAGHLQQQRHPASNDRWRRVEAEHVSSKDKESKRSDEAAAYVFARVPRAAQVFFIDIPTLPGFISRGVVLDIPFPVVAYFLFGRPIVVPASLSY